ncbi:MAG: SH3 domain-containing protein, partial [Verrucomicrobia bacterium]|nr:SH3 domain-containing protein [Verrucomicrobiota bacterium]
MKDAAAVRWFKMQFQKQIETALADTPFSVDLLTAIAMQETGYLWRAMVEAKLGIKKIL